MTLKDKLQKESRNAIEDYALQFACNVESKLAEEARDGRTEYLVSIADEHKHIFISPIFITALSDLLEDVKVEVIKVSTNSIFTSFKKEVLSLSWGDLND